MRKSVKLKLVYLRKDAYCEVCGKQLCRNRLSWYEFYVQNGKPHSVHRCYDHPFSKEFYNTYKDVDDYVAFDTASSFAMHVTYEKLHKERMKKLYQERMKELYEERMKEKKERLQK